MIKGKIDVDGAKEVIGKLDRTMVLTANYTGVWPAVGELYAGRERKLFAKDGQRKWKPLDPDYIQRRRSDGLGGKILIRTGRLRDAVTSPDPAKSNSRMAVFGPAGRSAPHYTLHKHGTKRMPKRDPLPALTKAERGKVRTIIADYVTSGWSDKPTSSGSTDPIITGLREALAAARARGDLR